ncbi:MAG: peptide ABC transporter substrate-binding protein [Sporichthyaceae bacterium]
MRVNKRSQRLVVLGLAGMLVVAGCGGDDEADGAGAGAGDVNAAVANPAFEGGSLTGPVKEGGEIKVEGCKPARPLIPADTVETCGGNMLDVITARLVRYNPDTAEAENDIAESIETKDNLTFTVKLKKGVKFHDGTAVDAKSFVDAWNFSANAKQAYLASTFFAPIDGYTDVNPEDPDGEEGPKKAPEPKADVMSGLKVVNPSTFTIKLAEKGSTFAQRLGYTAFAPLPESFFTDDGKAFGKKPIGAGPFKMEKYDPNRESVLVKDSTYDRVGKPHVDKVTFVVIDPNPGYEQVVANQLDINRQIPSAKLVSGIFRDDLGERFVRREAGVIQTITFPPKTTDPAYDNVKIRQAISLAIDRQAVINLAFPDRKPATGWVAPVAGGYKAGACGDLCDFDPVRAKALLAEAGGFPGTMSLSYNADGDHKTWTEGVCNQIKNNLDVECIATPVVDFATFRTAVEAREQKGMFRTGWQMDYPSIENFLEPLYKTGASSNDGLYSDPAFDMLLAQAASEADEADVFATYQQAEALLKVGMPVIPLWYSSVVVGHSEKVTNVKLTVFGTYDLTSVSVV